MLVEVGEALFSGAFVGRADPGPDLKLDDGRAVALAKQNLQAIGQHAVGRGFDFGRCGLVQSAPRVPEPTAARSRLLT